MKTVMNSDNRIKVYVGYAWQHVEDCTCDSRWSSIKRYFKATNDAIAKQYGIGVDFRRLRASHGRFIWESIREKINNADILLFDVGAIPAKLPVVGGEISYDALNENVVLELGAALSKPKAKILLLCPKSLTKRLPSDLSGLCYTSYVDVLSKDGVKRRYEDKWGALPQYRSMIADAIEDHGWGAVSDDDDEYKRSGK